MSDNCIEDVSLALKLGREKFMGMEFEVGPGALVPRRETELLARTAIETLREAIETRGAGPSPIVFDLCCGVGNLACAIASALPKIRVLASDIAPACVDLARRNVTKHGLESRVTVMQGDLLQPYEPLDLAGKVFAIVCNPPYISTGKLEVHCAHLKDEPIEAFAAGPYGIAIHQRVCRESPLWLMPGGWLFFEYGAGQGKQVRALVERTRRFTSVETFEPDPGRAGTLRAAAVAATDAGSNS